MTGVDFERETGLGDIVLWTAFFEAVHAPPRLGLWPHSHVEHGYQRSAWHRQVQRGADGISSVHHRHQLSLPLGIGFDTLIKIGRLPVKIGLEAYYYVERDDDFGPKFQLRFLFVPILPAPEWSRRPLF